MATKIKMPQIRIMPAHAKAISRLAKHHDRTATKMLTVILAWALPKYEEALKYTSDPRGEDGRADAAAEIDQVLRDYQQMDEWEVRDAAA